MSDSTGQRPPLLDALSVGPVGVTSPVEVERARAKMLPWLEERVVALPEERAAHFRHEHLRRAFGWMASGLAVAAAAALAVLFGGAETRGRSTTTDKVERALSGETATLVTGKLQSHSHTWTGGQEVALLGRLSAGAEGAALQVDRRYRLELRPASAVSFERVSGSGKGSGSQKNTSLYLHHGLAKISVLPLPQGSELVVKTGDVLLTIVKAAFTVEAHGSMPSCVRVSAGEVEVVRGMQRQVVPSGGSFGCSQEKSLGIEASPVPIQKKSAGASRTTLSQENALLSQALLAERLGRTSEARSSYQQLLTKYPRSAFAQDARAGLKRLPTKN